MNHSENGQGSVTRWISAMRQGDPEAIRRLVERYFGKLRKLSQERIRRGAPIFEDGEDIAIQVLTSVCQKVEEGKYPDLQNRDDLWYLMIFVAHRLVIDRRRSRKNLSLQSPVDLEPIPREETLEGALEAIDNDMDTFLAEDAESDFQLLEIIDCWQEMIRQIKDPVAKKVAQLKLEGHSNREIAALLDIVPRTVERKSELIEQRWAALYESLDRDH
jgi:DNA-directed RNA polymerase specialized sigma24 family protein